MTTTPNMSLVLPTEGGSSNVWDVILDVAFGLIDSHDHSTGQGVQVPTAGININADLSFAGFSLTHLKRIALDEQLSTPGNKSIWTSSADHDLYWTNSSGVDVKITDGSTLNVSLVGGIGGDYSSVGALLSYDDATRRYLLQQEGSPRPWAGLATADIDLYEKAPSISNKITLKSPSALAASYTLTLPGALPGAQKVLQVDASGNIIASNVFAGAIECNDLGNNGAMAWSIGPAAFQLPSSGGSYARGASGGINALTLGTANKYTAVIPCRTGDAITGMTVRWYKNSSNTTTLTASIVTLDTATGAETVQGSVTNNQNATGASNTNAAIPTSVPAGTEAYVVVSGGADVSDLCRSVEISYTRANGAT